MNSYITGNIASCNTNNNNNSQEKSGGVGGGGIIRKNLNINIADNYSQIYCATPSASNQHNSFLAPAAASENEHDKPNSFTALSVLADDAVQAHDECNLMDTTVASFQYKTRHSSERTSDPHSHIHTQSVSRTQAHPHALAHTNALAPSNRLVTTAQRRNVSFLLAPTSVFCYSTPTVNDNPENQSPRQQIARKQHLAHAQRRQETRRPVSSRPHTRNQARSLRNSRHTNAQHAQHYAQQQQQQPQHTELEVMERWPQLMFNSSPRKDFPAGNLLDFPLISSSVKSEEEHEKSNSFAVKSRFANLEIVYENAATHVTVTRGTNRLDGQLYMLKTCTIPEVNSRIQKEIIILSDSDHSNIVQYHGSWIDDDRLHIQLGFVGVGHTLHTFLHAEDSLVHNFGVEWPATLKTRPDRAMSVTCARAMFDQLESALIYLHHSTHTTHNRIEPCHVLLSAPDLSDPQRVVTSDWQVKLCGFGEATTREQLARPAAANDFYNAAICVFQSLGSFSRHKFEYHLDVEANLPIEIPTELLNRLNNKLSLYD